MATQNRTLRAKALRTRAHPTLASTTAAFALSIGWSMEQINQACGVSGLDLVNPNERLPDDVVPRLWRALQQEQPEDKALTLEMARAAPFSCFAGLAEGMQFAETLHQALELMNRNRVLLADRVEMELIENDGRVVLRGSHPSDDIDQGRTSEVIGALLVRMIREFLGVGDAIVRISLRYAPWGPPEAYEEYFGVPVSFNQPRAEIEFRKDRMDSGISHANTELFAYVEQHFAQAAQQIQQGVFPAPLGKLREAIADNASMGEFGSRAAAERARMSLRSAQRLATTHGYSLRGLIDDIRTVYAEELLSDPRLTTSRVAELLGYSDARAFRRAFKRWTGKSPSRFRA